MDMQLDGDVAALRAFNRIYTRKLGLLDACLDGSPFTLSEARILYELANRVDPTSAEIARALDLDPAQMSRTIKRFAGRGLIEMREDPNHGRHQLLALTAAGRSAFAALDGNTRSAVGSMLDALPAWRRRRLLSAAGTIARIFADDSAQSLSLRGLRPGDLGLVTARQAIVYAQEFGWNAEYEVVVARILADFQQSYDPARDGAWIADLDGRMVGSIFLAHGDTPEVGRLRLLYVEPDARGAGVGRMLVDACVERARAVGYDRLVLWTNHVLVAARRIYERAGFKLLERTPHRSFGQDLVGETWSLDLGTSCDGALSTTD